MAKLSEIESYLDKLLQPGLFTDYCTNGLQVEGKREVRRICTAVSASRKVIQKSIEHNADLLLVHHGIFWNRDSYDIKGVTRDKLKSLLCNDISLIAYHLPLDAHPLWGNNAQLGRVLGWASESQFGEQSLGCLARASYPSAQAVADHVAQALGRAVTLVQPAPDGAQRPIRRVAWCTGGAQGYFESAIAAGADAFITGEISEPQAHLAREMGVAYLACGHHASERYGAQAVACHVAVQLGLEHVFIDIDNPA